MSEAPSTASQGQCLGGELIVTASSSKAHSATDGWQAFSAEAGHTARIEDQQSALFVMLCGAGEGSPVFRASTRICKLHLLPLPISVAYPSPYSASTQGQRWMSLWLTVVQRLLRYIDDFLLVTDDYHLAKRFIRTMSKGFPEYGAFISPGKTLVNFEYASGAEVAPVCTVDSLGASCERTILINGCSPFPCPSNSERQR